MVFRNVGLVASLPGFALSSDSKCSASAKNVPVRVLPMCQPYTNKHSEHFRSETYGESLAAVISWSGLRQLWTMWGCVSCVNMTVCEPRLHSWALMGLVLMFRATSEYPDVKMVTVHDPFRLLDYMVQHSRTTESTGDSTHLYECWLLDVERLSTPHLLQCLVTSPRLLEASYF